MKVLAIIIATLTLSALVLIIRYYFLKRKLYLQHSKEISAEMYKYVPTPYDIGRITLDARDRHLKLDKNKIGNNI